MSKVFGGLLSLDASGKFGRTIVYSKWRGVPYARLLVTPSNPRTALQVATRVALAAVGKVTKRADLSGDEVTFIKTITPAGQSWNSYFGREIVGAGLVNFDAAKSFYNNVSNATIKGYFDAAAATAGIEGVTIPGDTPGTATAGLALLAAYSASNRMGSPDASVALGSVTEGNVEDYTTALTGATFA